MGNSAAGHLLHDLQQLQDGRSAFRPEVERNAPATVAEMVERTDMGVGKIANMDVVPNRTAVRRWKIRAVDIETWNPAIHRHEQRSCPTGWCRSCCGEPARRSALRWLA